MPTVKERAERAFPSSPRCRIAYEIGFTDAMQQRTEVTDTMVEAALIAYNSEPFTEEDSRTASASSIPNAATRAFQQRCVRNALEAYERVRSEEGS